MIIDNISLCVKNQWYPICRCWCGRKVNFPHSVYISGHNSRGRQHSEATKRKISNSQPTKITTPLPLCSCGCGKQVNNREAKYIQYHQNIGKPRTPETKAKIRQANLGRVDSPERKAKAGAKHKGHKWTAAQKAKLRVIRRKMELEGRGVTGTKRSFEARINMKVAALKRVTKEIEEFGKVLAFQGHDEIKFVRTLQRFTPFVIEESFLVGKPGYKDVPFAILDGFIEELCLAIEFDEEYHRSFKQKRADEDRESMVQMSIPDVIFWRVDADDWMNDPKEVINDFLYMQDYVRDMKVYQKIS